MDIYTSMDRRTVLFDIIADDAVVFVAYPEDDWVENLPVSWSDMWHVFFFLTLCLFFFD